MPGGSGNMPSGERPSGNFDRGGSSGGSGGERPSRSSE